MNTETFGKTIKKKRLELGLTQKGLADKLFITDKAVSKWERGISFPDLEKLEQISKILDIPLSVLLGEKPSDNANEQLIQMVKDNVESQYLKAQKRSIIKNRRRIITCILAALLICFAVVILFPRSYRSRYEENSPIEITVTKFEDLHIKVYDYFLNPGTPEYVAFMNMNGHYHMHLSLLNIFPFLENENSSDFYEVANISIVQPNNIVMVTPINGNTSILNYENDDSNDIIMDMGYFTIGDEKDYSSELCALLDTLEPASII